MAAGFPSQQERSSGTGQPARSTARREPRTWLPLVGQQGWNHRHRFQTTPR